MKDIIAETVRLRLRPYTTEDFADLYAILSDPETMKHYPKPYDEAGTQRWLTWCLDSYARHGFGLWAVELRETGEFIGDCGISMQPIDGQSLPEVGYHIRRSSWRMGFAKEAAAAVRDWGFRNRDFDALYSYMNVTNTASTATALSIGMKKLKTYPDPRGVTYCVCRITRGEWEEMGLG